MVAISLHGGAGLAQAAQFRSGGTVIIEADEIVGEDLYVFGGEVIVHGTVQGDLVVFAGQITVNGMVTGDLSASGRTVVLNGAVGDDIRMVGEVLKLGSTSEVGDDIIAAGFSFESEDESTVDGDICYAGYQARFAGTVGKDITGTMSNCELIGAVGGDVRIGLNPDETASETKDIRPAPPVPAPGVPAGLTVASAAEIDGVLSYRSPIKGNIEEGADIAGGIEYEPHVVSSPKAEPTNVDKALALARQFACLAIVGLCLLLILPRWSQGLAESVRTRPLASLGSGLLGILFFAVSLIVLLVVIVALAFGFGLLTLDGMIPVVLIVGLLSVIGLAGGFWFFVFYIAQIAVSLALGRFMLFAGRTNHRILPFLAGLVVLVVLMNLHHVTNLRYAGEITNAIVAVVGFGGLVLWIIGSRRRRSGD